MRFLPAQVSYRASIFTIISTNRADNILARRNVRFEEPELTSKFEAPEGRPVVPETITGRSKSAKSQPMQSVPFATIKMLFL